MGRLELGVNIWMQEDRGAAWGSEDGSSLGTGVCADAVRPVSLSGPSGVGVAALPLAGPLHQAEISVEISFPASFSLQGI